MRFYLTTLMVALLPVSAHAEVKSATEAGFAVSSTVEIAASPDAVYALIANPADWWLSDHTYSGDAANMTIDPRAGGCFCEAIPGRDGAPSGSIEHARVIYAQPGRLLRMSGALGPLQAEAAIGTLTFSLKPHDGVTSVTMDYAVGGYVRGGAGSLATVVDMVLGQQLQSLAAHAAKQ